MARISSTHNPVVKYVRSLERARVRREEGVFLAEGVRLVGEAFAARQRASVILYDPDLLGATQAGSSLLRAIPGWAERSFEVSPHVLSVASQTETPAGVIAVLQLPWFDTLTTHANDAFGIVLDRLADPGNVGTMLRTSAAAGVTYVAALPDTVDLFAPKVVRAGMGAHFKLPIYQPVAWDEITDSLPCTELVVMEVEGGTSLYEFDWPDRTALVVGSEAHGLSQEAIQRAGARVHIPMRAGVESLNASVAASIVMYHALGPGILAG